MKLRFTLLALLAVAMAAGCGKKTNDLTVKEVEVNSKSDHLTVNIVRSLVSSDNAKVDANCAIFNDHVENFITQLQEELKVQIADYAALLAGSSDENTDEDFLYEFTVRNEVFTATEKYVSLLLSVYVYTGGAHGAHDLYAFNFDVRNGKFLENSALLSYLQAPAIDKAIADNFTNPEGCFNEAPALENATAVNFTADSFVFSYKHYVLGPYSCGMGRVKVPTASLGAAVLIE